MAGIWRMLKETFSRWSAHEGPRLGAALTFYTILSLAPLLVLVTGIAALAFGAGAAQGYILEQTRSLVGEEGADAIRSVMHSAEQTSGASLASALGLVALLFGASGVFAELRSALNKVWEVDPRKTSGLMEMAKDRFFSIGMVLAIGFLLLVSLVVSAILAALGENVGRVLPVPPALLYVVNVLVSLAGITLLFGLIFKYVPEIEIGWRRVWVGAFATALLFTVGKFLIGMYLGKASLGSAYGAAGSLVVTVVWMYYSSLIFYFGADFTRVWAEAHGWRREGAAGSAEGAPAPKAQGPAAVRRRAVPAPQGGLRGARTLALTAGAVWAVALVLIRRRV